MSSSPLYPNEIILDDDTPEELHSPEGFGRGLDLSGKGPRGYEGSAIAFPPSLLVPRSEYQARVQEMEATKTRVSDLIVAKKLDPLNQSSTNYCWSNCVIGAAEVVRLQQNQPTVRLSPASIAAQIKQYRNIGGWPKEAIDFLSTHGCNTVDQWPPNAIDDEYASALNRQAAKNYIVNKWVEATTFEQFASLLFHRVPAAAGFLWWGHAVYGADPVWLDGELAIRIRNSWGNWGDYGFGILRGSRAKPDDAVGALVMTAT